MPTRLLPTTQHYSWGVPSPHSLASQFSASPTTIPQNTPTAELWMGTHTKSPSILRTTNKPIPENLPYLFKVLAIQTALSIQAHPDKKLAEKLHREKPEIYKDANHKPEMCIALDHFEGLCGFRLLPECVDLISKYETLLVGDESLISTQEWSEIKQCSQEKTEAASKKGLKMLLTAFMKPDTAMIVQKFVDHAKSSKEVNTKGSIEELAVRLEKQYPGDIGALCPLLLNYLSIPPFGSFFMMANEPHAYLSGNAVECMATSDNVVRAGLTPKLKDVETLLSMLTYTSSVADEKLLKPVKAGDHSLLYDPPIEEFSVLLTQLQSEQRETLPAKTAGSILLCTEGSGKFGEEEMKRGNVFYIKGGESPSIVAGQQGCTTFTAFQH